MLISAEKKNFAEEVDNVNPALHFDKKHLSNQIDHFLDIELATIKVIKDRLILKHHNFKMYI